MYYFNQFWAICHLFSPIKIERLKLHIQFKTDLNSALQGQNPICIWVLLGTVSTLSPIFSQFFYVWVKIKENDLIKWKKK